LARLILAGSVIEARGGRVLSSGFAVDMNSVFEDFVVVALREALGLSPRRFRQGDGTLRLDRAGKVTLRPDVTWWEGGRCVFAGDVKYKRIKASGILHPDLYQLLAYSVASDLPGGLLIYAAGEDEAATHEVVHVGKRLDVVTLDLAGNIEDVLGQINGVAGRVRRWRRKARMAA
jgi:5-methylcytosine-specific restriction enzyme subunit McrC